MTILTVREALARRSEWVGKGALTIASVQRPRQMYVDIDRYGQLVTADGKRRRIGLETLVKMVLYGEIEWK